MSEKLCNIQDGLIQKAKAALECGVNYLKRQTATTVSLQRIAVSRNEYYGETVPSRTWPDPLYYVVSHIVLFSMFSGSFFNSFSGSVLCRHMKCFKPDYVFRLSAEDKKPTDTPFVDWTRFNELAQLRSCSSSAT
ncbi:hypothetical protein BCR43DRAFT_378466 [Syncephalastrum racemosum]|uniref:Uncharacterized protein n=1 Tax=Syncephalastrum racemosum TaxID=13706 RepID=A0A1X2H4Z5_SYNRA|nr:hypothetical protein BCR43DRAFT_378466 [Syncephalastrum racemosum]